MQEEPLEHPPAVRSRAANWLRRPRLRWALGILVSLALLWSATALVVPGLVASQAARAGHEMLGRELQLGHVAFNPWTLELEISDLALTGAAGAAPQLRVQRIHADASITSLFRLAPVVDHLDIEAPSLRLARRADGSTDADDMLQRLLALPASPEPARFALHNVVVRGGSFDFSDAGLGRTHQLRELELGIPFLSSLPSQREVRVEPHLAFLLDGTRFDSRGAATPWAERGNGEIRVKLDRLDLAPFLGYLPAGLPARPLAAALTADILLAFEQRPKLSLRISGSLGLSDLKVADAAAQELLSAGSIKVQIDELRPLDRLLKLGRIDIDAPRLLAARDRNGRINLLLEATAANGAAAPVAKVPMPAAAASVARAASGASAGGGAAKVPAASPWTFALATLAVRAGRLDWRDAVPVPAASLSIEDFVFDAQAIAWPADAPVVFSGSGAASQAALRGRFEFAGRGNATGASASIKLDAMPLALAAPYAKPYVALPLAGDLSAELAGRWQPGPAGGSMRLDAARVALSNASLGDPRAPELAAARIELLDLQASSDSRTVALGSLRIEAPRARLERAADGSLNVARWRVAASAAAPSASASASAQAPAAPWSIAVASFAVDKGKASFVDRALPVPAAFDISDLSVQLRSWALQSAATAVAPLRIGARVSVPAGPSGKAAGSGVVGSIDVRGELRDFAGGVPRAGKARVARKDLPLHLAGPYLDGLLDIEVQKAQTGFGGDLAWELRPEGPRLQARGDLVVDDFRANSSTAERGGSQRALVLARDGSGGRQLLAWKSLSLRGIDLAVAPAAPLRLAVAQTSLSDFYARVVLDETGRLNLQDVARAPRPAASASASATVALAAAPSSAAPVIRFGPITVSGGRVNFNDRFVRPNYSANLSELAGSLAAFSSEPAAAGVSPQLAELGLRGRVEGTATLEVAGQVNPLARPLALDIGAKVRDLELPPLSPYAIKYAGYGIERGKLSVDVAYLVKPDGQLTASNKIVLNQLAFGDKVEGAPASLPVKLAVALLADRRGVIDLDLPVSGSLNDPQFSLGGVIWKVITNLVAKAVTAPFALLSSAFGGGGSELSTVEFAPGTAVLAQPAKDSLDKVARALLERPALSLTVTGESRLDAEREGWKHDRLKQFLRSEKRRQAIAAGAAATAEVVVAEAETPALLKEVYRRADIASKPKNALGFAQDVPAAQMEALLLASIVIPDDAMQQLAVRRGVAVRDYLASRQLPTSRLFLGAPRQARADDAGWTPRADLKLASE